MAKNVVVKAEKVYGRKKKYSSIKLILSISPEFCSDIVF